MKKIRSSAAIFFEDEDQLRRGVQEVSKRTNLKPTYLKGDKGFSLHFAIPNDIRIWKSWIGMPFMLRFAWPSFASDAREACVEWMTSEDAAFTISLKTNDYKTSLSRDMKVGITKKKPKSDFSIAKQSCDATFPAELLKAWQGKTADRIRVQREGWKSEVLDVVSLSAVVANLKDFDKWTKVTIEDNWGAIYENGWDFVFAILTNKKKEANVSLEVYLNETNFDRNIKLVDILPGFLGSGCGGVAYPRGFDVFARSDLNSAAARYPCWLIKRDGYKIQVDIVHRDVGDFYLDFQPFWFPDDPTPPDNLLTDLMDEIGLPNQVWHESLFRRWETFNDSWTKVNYAKTSDGDSDTNYVAVRHFNGKSRVESREALLECLNSNRDENFGCFTIHGKHRFPALTIAFNDEYGLATMTYEECHYDGDFERDFDFIYDEYPLREEDADSAMNYFDHHSSEIALANSPPKTPFMIAIKTLFWVGTNQADRTCLHPREFAINAALEFFEYDCRKPTEVNSWVSVLDYDID